MRRTLLVVRGAGVPSVVAPVQGHLNRLHRSEPALHEVDFDPAGFEWIDASDARVSVVSFLRSLGLP